MISAVGDHKETRTCTQTHISVHKFENTGLSAVQAYKGTHGSLVASAPVIVFTFTPESEDRGPVVGVNKCSGKRREARNERAEW